MDIKVSMSRSFSRVYANSLLLGMMATVGTIGPQVGYAESHTFYKETFQYCTGTIGKSAADEAGWMGLVTGLPKEKISNLKVFSYGSSIVGGAVNSSPHGRAQGYSFWFRPVYGLSVLTAEQPFDVSLISQYPSTVEYEQRLSGVDVAGVMNQTQLLFLIDNNWYISGTATRQTKPAAWEPVSIDPSVLLYGVVPYAEGLGAATPASYTNSLPLTGSVRAFGVFVAEVNGRVRIDNFTITTTGPVPPTLPTAVQQTSVAYCPLTSPDVIGGGGPTPTPDPDDGDGGTDHGTPDPLPPLQTTPHATPQVQSASFCATNEQGAGMRVRISRSAQKVFVNRGAKTGSLAFRDRAVAHLFATRLMPIGAVVNIRIGDYDQATRKLRLSLKKGAAPKFVKLPGAVRTSIKRYIASLGSSALTTDPLFVSAVGGGQALNMKKAACSAEIKAIIKKRAKAAKLPLRRVFVK